MKYELVMWDDRAEQWTNDGYGVPCESDSIDELAADAVGIWHLPAFSDVRLGVRTIGTTEVVEFTMEDKAALTQEDTDATDRPR